MFPRLRSRLLKWYRAHARDLPWRRTKDPYPIWVSEIMLQQTQVAAVIPYYERWLRRFPTVESLARAREPEVMKYWAGLGYYRRARRLHRAARMLVRKRGQVRTALRACPLFPESVPDLLRLPGIGRYTAGAIASIAFGRPEPVVDGNVKRVLARIFAVTEAVDRPAGEKRLWGIAGALVKGRNPGDLNQALMELGATVCVPERPRCPACPARNLCRAFQRKRPEDFPVVSRREKSEKLRTAALVLRRNGKVLLQKQPSGARWGSLWVFPYIRKPGQDMRKIMTVRHGFTKYRVTLEVFEPGHTSHVSHKLRKASDAFWFSGREAKNQRASETFRPRNRSKESLVSCGLCPYDLRGRWIPISRLPRLPLPSPHRKIAEALLGND